MAVNISLPVLFSNLPHLSHVASVEQNHPEVMQQYGQDAARQTQLKEREQVQQMDKQEGSTQVSKDGGGNAAQDQPRRRRERQPEEPESQESGPNSPWTGNIVNVKI